tara:strand:+ start:93 stop:476 length:384 start_codon:yes stop_codon:yes gene_type:complete
MNVDRKQLEALGRHDQTRHRGQRAYWIRQRTRVSWRVIARQLKYSAVEGARGAAKRYASRNNLPWPVKILSRGEMFYAAFASGETWYDIGRDFMVTPDHAQNSARGWARIHKKAWPPRKKERWEKGL